MPNKSNTIRAGFGRILDTLMGRISRDPKIHTKTARAELPRRNKPYFRLLEPGLYLGYRRGRSGGTWVARWYTDYGKYSSKSIGKADDGDLVANGKSVLNFSMAVELARKECRPPHDVGTESGPYLVRHAIEDYLRSLEKRGKSASKTRNRAELHILPKLGHLDCEKLGRPQIRHWHEELAHAPPRVRGGACKVMRTDSDIGIDGHSEFLRRRKSSANRTLTVLKAALNQAFQEERIASDAGWRSIKPFRSVDAARVRYLEIDEAQRLIEACSSDLRPLVHAALLTGARYGELVRMRVCDFDQRASTVIVRESKAGKARHIHMNEEGTDLLRLLIKRKNPNDFIFTRCDGLPWKASQQTRPLLRACKSAGLAEPANFHSLRHTYATHAIMNGAPLVVVAKNLGHSDTRMVEKHYGHLAASFMAETIRRTVPHFSKHSSLKI